MKLYSSIEIIPIHLKAYHFITMNNSEETRIQINDKKPKKLGYYNRPWTKTRRVLGIKAVLRRMTNLRKNNYSVHCATNNEEVIHCLYGSILKLQSHTLNGIRAIGSDKIKEVII